VNQQEITDYLAASHIAVVATINRHGHPHLTPNWYRYDGKVLTLITRTDRLKYLNLQRDNHIAVCIYDPPVASNYVVISGTATCNDQDIWDEARRIIALQGGGRGGRLCGALENGAACAHYSDTGAYCDTGTPVSWSETSGGISATC
jgi:PPOX class probable F420-dependent enzyme